MGRGALLLALCMTVVGCHYDLSFKRIDLVGVEYSTVFELCRKVIASRYSGTFIREDLASGRIETGLVEFETVDHEPRRERVLCLVQDLGEGRVVVELIAEIKEMTIDPEQDNPVIWRTIGSDVKAERILLEDIVGEVGMAYPDRLVMETPLDS